MLAVVAVMSLWCGNVQDLGLRDYARLDGFVQLPPKTVEPRERPAELDVFVNPKIDDLAAAARPTSNEAR